MTQGGVFTQKKVVQCFCKWTSHYYLSGSKSFLILREILNTSHRLSYNESASKQKDNCSNKVTFTVYLNSFPFITLSSSHGSSQVILTVQSILLLLTYIVSALSSSSVFKVR